MDSLWEDGLKSITVSSLFKNPCYFPFQVLTFHSTVMTVLVFSFFSSILDLVWLNVCDWGYQTVIQSEDWIRSNSSITLSPFHSLYALSHIAKECFIIAMIPRLLSPPSCKLSPRKLLSPGELLFVIWYHSHLSWMCSWTTYELGTEILPPSFRNSLELVASSESFRVTLCVYWMDKSISSRQFSLVRNKMSSRNSGGGSPHIFWAKNLN